MRRILVSTFKRNIKDQLDLSTSAWYLADQRTARLIDRAAKYVDLGAVAVNQSRYGGAFLYHLANALPSGDQRIDQLKSAIHRQIKVNRC